MDFGALTYHVFLIYNVGNGTKSIAQDFVKVLLKVSVFGL